MSIEEKVADRILRAMCKDREIERKLSHDGHEQLIRDFNDQRINVDHCVSQIIQEVRKHDLMELEED